MTQEMQADFAALNGEAGEWDTTSARLAEAAATASGLSLSAAELSFVSFLTDVETSYADAQQRVVDVCEAGARETARLAEALRQVARDFRSSDEEVVAAISEIWIPE